MLSRDRIRHYTVPPGVAKNAPIEKDWLRGVGEPSGRIPHQEASPFLENRKKPRTKLAGCGSCVCHIGSISGEEGGIVVLTVCIVPSSLRKTQGESQGGFPSEASRF